jgi:hypothetical protein
MIGLWFAVQTARDEASKERASQQRLVEESAMKVGLFIP